ncbi:exodeoxyribonuclease-like [Juglans microcarpa x Juglans regia]|uniref:exodeoxyribonuclease-like n=1 Tax=Juglans microcarpa x Juglans regia TaxID=2249226 RepID=UPI001B7E0A3B|nr:exodeoxyribonuclease-like [Juglans microcarpa x Juglans regia]
MKPKILSWNVRGLNDRNKRLCIKSLLRSWKIDVVCIQETKLRTVDRRLIRNLWGCLYVGWSYLPSEGAAEGVLLMWDKRVVEVTEECIGTYSVANLFKNVVDGPNSDSERRRLWEELAGVHCLWDVPWCMGGDFNITRFPSARSGNSHISTAMEEFSEFMFDLDLMDLPLIGGKFTWSNSRGWSRLDRFIISPSWEAHFPELRQKRLAQVCSDHFPILLDCGGVHRGCQYF